MPTLLPQACASQMNFGATDTHLPTDKSRADRLLNELAELHRGPPAADVHLGYYKARHADDGCGVDAEMGHFQWARAYERDFRPASPPFDPEPEVVPSLAKSGVSVGIAIIVHCRWSSRTGHARCLKTGKSVYFDNAAIAPGTPLYDNTAVMLVYDSNEPTPRALLISGVPGAKPVAPHKHTPTPPARRPARSPPRGRSRSPPRGERHRF